MLAKTILGILLAMAGVVVIYHYLKSRHASETIVIGQEMASANKKERQRLSRGETFHSPLPTGVYESRKGEWGLVNPARVELDSKLRESCASFAALQAAEIEAFRSSISMEEFYQLISFARRSAVFALRDEDRSILTDGLIALAMIEAERTDYRDVLVALSLLHHTADRLNVDPSVAFRNAAALSEPGVSDLMIGFVERDPSGKRLEESWGYREVETASGIGFADWGFRKYEPETDLFPVAMRIASFVEEDAYVVDRIQLATEFPEFWLQSPQAADLKSVLAGTNAGVTISARLDEKQDPESENQSFIVFTVEMDSEELAQALLKFSRDKQPENFAMLGRASGKVFSLIVARSFMEGVEAFESGDSLERFGGALQKALDQSS